MSEFAKASPNLTALVNAAASFEEIAQLCRKDAEQRGPSEARPAAPAATPVDNGWGFSRVIYVGNSRFELVSSSESGLDAQETKIRSALER